jgi:hypothetical protein
LGGFCGAFLGVCVWEWRGIGGTLSCGVWSDLAQARSELARCMGFGGVGVWEGRGGDLGRDFVALGVGDVMNGLAALGGLRGNGE